MRVFSLSIDRYNKFALYKVNTKKRCSICKAKATRMVIFSKKYKTILTTMMASVYETINLDTPICNKRACKTMIILQKLGE